MDDDKIKANCARALKNLTSDSTEAIEEGAVAALIAMSLEGKSKSNKVSDEIVPPSVPVYGKSPLPPCADEKIDAERHQFVVTKSVTAGGESDTALSHPDPPVTEDAHEDALYPAEELDGPEADVRAKMAFAKMQVPGEIKEVHLLRDEDFVVKESDDSDEAENPPGPGQDGYVAYDDDGIPIQVEVGSEEAKSASVSAKNSPKNSKTPTPVGSPKTSFRKSGINSGLALPSPSGGATGDSEGKFTPNNSNPGSPKVTRNKSFKGKAGGGAEGIDEAKTSVAAKKSAKGEKDMKAQAAQLGLYK